MRARYHTVTSPAYSSYNEWHRSSDAESERYRGKPSVAVPGVQAIAEPADAFTEDSGTGRYAFDFAGQLPSNLNSVAVTGNIGSACVAGPYRERAMTLTLSRRWHGHNRSDTQPQT